MLIQITNRFSNAVIFQSESENNSVKKTVELAIREGVSLSNADLEGADLSDANLSEADLSCAILTNTNLTCANLSKAVLRRARLRCANLTGANLHGATLAGADMPGSKLTGATLRHVNFTDANLRHANLRGADLQHANLHGANLRCASLAETKLAGADISCIGDMIYIFTIQLDTWEIGFTKDFMKIGCQAHTIDKWRNFTDEEIDDMDKDALEWWKKWKDFIFRAMDLTINYNK